MTSRSHRSQLLPRIPPLRISTRFMPGARRGFVGALVAALAMAGASRLAADEVMTLASAPWGSSDKASAATAPLLSAGASLLPEWRLPALEPARLAADSEAAGGPGKTWTVGIVRPTGLEIARIGGPGAWFDGGAGAGDDGIWALRVVSPGATFVRGHLTGELAAGSTLWVRRPDGRVMARFPGPRQGAFWTPSIAGDSLRLELETAANTVSSLRLIELAHGFRELAQPAASESAGPCHVDVTCSPEWASAAAGVARIAYVVDGEVRLCSGQLLNNKKNDRTPFFLTSLQCINDPEVASTAEFFWFYRTAECGGPPPSLDDVPRSLGAFFLKGGATSDFSLLEVLGSLPEGVSWLGWVSTPVPNGTPAVSIHHPAGEFQRISFGAKAAGAGEACADGVNDSNHVRIDWVDGVTEAGSVGAGVFRQAGGALFGQLHCGPSSCAAVTNDSYGSFAKTYPAIKVQLTGGGTDDRSEPNDSCRAARVVKAGSTGGRIVKSTDVDWYRIQVPPQRSIEVKLVFTHDSGDVDLDVYAACTGDPFTFSHSQDNFESVTLQNVGTRPATLYWKVSLASDTRNLYDLEVNIN
jgi:hypothetical protein